MNSSSIEQVDIAIIGGGIGGLWLLNRLCNQGYNAVLFEQEQLGCQQTLASQGMIHGGIKYALGGALTGASEAIADMPDHWRRCLRGEGDVDLTQTKVLSDHFYMWSTQSIASKVTSFFASKITQGRVDTVSKEHRPEVFQDKAFKGSLYKLVDLVLDAPSVVANLAANYSQRIFSIDWQHSHFQQDNDGSVQSLQASDGNNRVSFSAQRFIFCAGLGNEYLLKLLNISKPEMQRRPLRQVLVKHRYPYALYAHCMGTNPSPRLTVSSHSTEDNENVWYLGGDLATDGAALSEQALISKAQRELKNLFPWLDFSDAQWATLFIDRAEPKQKGLIKPDKAFAETTTSCRNVIVGWPTKLTLAPNMANEVCRLLDADHIVPSHNMPDPIFQTLRQPVVGTPCWETLFPSSSANQ
jgi:glycine/D-amino acid oxidase-like deaminating enzyme